MNKDLSQEQILEKIAEIKSLVDQGWSIHLARKKILKGHMNIPARQVMMSREYLDLLNEHMEKRGLWNRYKHENNKIVLIYPKSCKKKE